MTKLLALLSLLLLLHSSCSVKDQTNYTLEEKVGQLIMIGFRGNSLNEDPALASQLANYQPGGIILYDYDIPTSQANRNIQNPSQLKSLIQDLKQSTKIPPFIAIDQEGGKVVRLKEKYGFQRTVSAQYLGTLNNLDSSLYYATRYADEMKELGINMNFAPVVDVNVNPDCPIIGKLERSFSADPLVVAQQASIFIKAYQDKGIICSLKHFPGHGSSLNDSHLGYTDVSATWQELELIPYQYLIDSGLVEMVMTAHVFNEFWDARYPATLSDNMIHNTLRQKLGFQGIVVSDDMCMGAIELNYSLKNSIELALQADVDMLVYSNNSKTYDPQMLQKVSETIIELVKEGRISEERIDKSFNKIIQLKNRYHL